MIRNVNVIKYLIIHHTWWRFASDLNQLCLDRTKSVSVHYLIDKQWVIFQLVWDNYIAYHTWQSDKWPIENISWWGWNLNPISLWIEISNLWDNKDEYTQLQKDALLELSLDLVNKYWIKTENILWHKEITVRKVDPSSNFFNWDMEWFRQEIEKIRNLGKIEEKTSNDNWIYKWISSYLLFDDLNTNYNIKRLTEISAFRYTKNILANTLSFSSETPRRTKIFMDYSSDNDLKILLEIWFARYYDKLNSNKLEILKNWNWATYFKLFDSVENDNDNKRFIEIWIYRFHKNKVENNLKNR